MMVRSRLKMTMAAAVLTAMPVALAPSVSAQANPVMCGGEVATIVGTAGDDDLLGTEGPDVIAGLQGSDVILGLGGDDIICGGIGDDLIAGGQGFDVIYGAQGNDLLFATTATDFELWQTGGVDGADTAGSRIFAGAGDDIVIGSDRWDRMQGGPGNDLMLGLKGRDWMRGGPGVDDITGDQGIDDVHGGNGDDRLLLEGADMVRGGAGEADECLRLFGPVTAKLISCEIQGDANADIVADIEGFRS